MIDEQQIAEIRDRVTAALRSEEERDNIWAGIYADDVPVLLAFAEAALPIVRAVAGLVSDDYCAWEDKHAVMQAVQHAPDCPVTLARRALAGGPATAEQGSEGEQP